MHVYVHVCSLSIDMSGKFCTPGIYSFVYLHVQM